MNQQILEALGVPEEESNDSGINVTEWLDKIKKARNKENHWRTRSEKIVKIYRDDNAYAESTTPKGSETDTVFNILYSNTETLQPALFSAVPKPDVRNRYMQSDEASHMAGDVIERSLSYAMDVYPFKRIIKTTVKDYLLTGRGVVRARLTPKFETQTVSSVEIDEMGNPVQTEVEEEKLIGHEVSCEAVNWDSFVVEPCRKWEDVTWIAFIHMLTKEEFQKYFPGAPLIEASKEISQYSSSDKYKVYEVWDKNAKQIYFLADTENPLKVLDDPMQLTNFWPIPQPLYSIMTSDTLVPIPEYTLYQAQAQELDETSRRITGLVKSCKYVGIYDANEPKISELFDTEDTQFIPVTANRMQAGTKSLVDVLDITQISSTLNQLYQQREQIKSIIYEITGISDIIRGESNASETATAQNIKASYAGLRLRDRRDNINIFIVELLRIKAELICTFFSDQQLQEMSGIKLDYSQEQLPPPPPPPQFMPGTSIDPQSMMMYQQAQANYEMQIQPEIEKREIAKRALEIIRSDVLRSYSIDIETDSTVLADMQAEGQQRAATVGAITQFLTAAFPLVMQGLPIETAKALLKYGLQPAKISRELEDAIDLIGAQAPMTQMSPAMSPGMGGQPTQAPLPVPPAQQSGVAGDIQLPQGLQ